MPITSSAKKALRASRRKRVMNLRRIKTLRDSTKDVKKAAISGEGDAKALLAKAYKAIDKAAKRGVIKKGAADRKKSRLANALKKKAGK